MAEQNRYINQIVRQKNELKIYGFLLVLSHLTRKLADSMEADVISGKVDFWLVTSESGNGDNLKAFDNLKDQLLLDLRSTLKNAVVNNVRILPADLFSKRLPSRPFLTP